MRARRHRRRDGGGTAARSGAGGLRRCRHGRSPSGRSAGCAPRPAAAARSECVNVWLPSSKPLRPQPANDPGVADASCPQRRTSPERRAGRSVAAMRGVQRGSGPSSNVSAMRLPAARRATSAGCRSDQDRPGVCKRAAARSGGVALRPVVRVDSPWTPRRIASSTTRNPTRMALAVLRLWRPPAAMGSVLQSSFAARAAQAASPAWPGRSSCPCWRVWPGAGAGSAGLRSGWSGPAAQSPPRRAQPVCGVAGAGVTDAGGAACGAAGTSGLTLRELAGQVFAPRLVRDCASCATTAWYRRRVA